MVNENLALWSTGAANSSNCPLIFFQRDSEMPASDPYNIGHDIIGAAIAASMAKRSRDRVNVHNREETKDVAKQS